MVPADCEAVSLYRDDKEPCVLQEPSQQICIVGG